MGFINVQTQGAKGDGTTDDSGPIQAAFTLAATTLEPVHFPPTSKGYYYNSSTPIVIPPNVSVVATYPSAIVGGPATTHCFQFGPGGGSFPPLWDASQALRMSLPSAEGFHNGAGIYVNAYNGIHQPYIPQISNCKYGVRFDGTNQPTPVNVNQNTGLTIRCDWIFNCQYGVSWYVNTGQNAGATNTLSQMQGCALVDCYIFGSTVANLHHDYPHNTAGGVLLNGIWGLSSVDGGAVGMLVTPNTPVQNNTFALNYFNNFSTAVFQFGTGSSMAQCDWNFNTAGVASVPGTPGTLAWSNAAYAALGFPGGYDNVYRTKQGGQIKLGTGLTPSSTSNNRVAFNGGAPPMGNNVALRIPVAGSLAAGTTTTVYAYHGFLIPTAGAAQSQNAKITWQEQYNTTPNSHVSAILDNTGTNASEIAITVTHFAGTGSGGFIDGFFTIGL